MDRTEQLHCFLPPAIITPVDSVIIPDEQLAYLDQTGRQAYYTRGYRGQGIIVAVIDTGISEHPELTDESGNSKIIGGVSFCPYTDSWADDNGHGSHCGGIWAGNRVGGAPGVRLLAVKVLDGSGSNTVSNVIAGFEWAARWRGPSGRPVAFVSASLSIPVTLMTKAEVRRFDEAIKALVALDVPVFASIGNTGMDKTMRYPGMFQAPIAVGAVDKQRDIAYFSTRSPEVDICQIGTGVISCDRFGGYAIMSGTSQANPMAGATAALIACEHKIEFECRMPESVLCRAVRASADDLGAAGVDHEYGAGFFTLDRMDAAKEKIGMINSRDINDLRADVRDNCQILLDACNAAGYYARLSSTLRDQEYQEYLWEQNKAPRFVAYHGRGLAFDVFLQRAGKAIYDDQDFWAFVSALGKRMGFVWGGDWKSVDKPHFQWSAGGTYTADMVRENKLPPPMPLFEEEESMDMKGLIAMVGQATAAERAALQAALGNPVYKDIAAVPDYWRAETQQLMTAAAIDGGTAEEVDPSDVNMSRDALKAAVICKRYIDGKEGE